MNSKTIQYGPFTPQELETIASEMQRKNIPFEIAKDEQEEGKFKRIDYSNMVRQTHFRTEQYMAQIFYITVAKSDLGKISGTLEKLGFSTEVSEQPEELSNLESELVEEDSIRRRMGGSRTNPSSDDIFLRAKTERKKFNRRLIARLLVLGLFCQILWMFVFYVLL